MQTCGKLSSSLFILKRPEWQTFEITVHCGDLRSDVS